MEEENKEKVNKKERKYTDKDYTALFVSSAVLLFGFILVFFGSNKINTDIIEPEVSSTYKNYSEFIKEEKLSLLDGVGDLYDSLVTKTRDYGFYYSKNVTIDTIDNMDFLRYVLENYVIENDITISEKNNLECVYNSDIKETESCKSYSVIAIDKTKVDQYIVDHFNTERDFTPEKGESEYAIGYIPINGLNQAFLYDFTKNCYYVGYINRYNEQNYIYTKFVKQETDSDNSIIIYNKAVICNLSSINDLYCLRHIDDKKIAANIVFEHINSEDLNALKDISFKYKESDRFNTINSDYVFSTYKLQTFKHTFKKIDNKYYWYSTELVNE